MPQTHATRQERYAAFLTTEYSALEVPSRTRKYRVFRAQVPAKAGGTVTRFFFLGRNGAVRLNDRNRLTDAAVRRIIC